MEEKMGYIGIDIGTTNIKIIETDEKLKLLIKALEQCFKLLKKAGANKKAVIFTEKRETQQYLYDALKDSYKTYIYNGSKDYSEIYKKELFKEEE